GDQRARPWRKQKRDRGSYVPSTGPSGPSPRPPSPEQRLGSSLKVFGAASIACVGGNRLERVHDALSAQLVCDEPDDGEPDAADGLAERQTTLAACAAAWHRGHRQTATPAGRQRRIPGPNVS